MADESVNSAAERLSTEKNLDKMTRILDFETMKKIIREDQMTAWQLSWNQSTLGRVTRELVPNVKTKVNWSRVRTIDMLYGRMLLGSANVKDNMQHMRFSESPNCDCEKYRETVEHDGL